MNLTLPYYENQENFKITYSFNIETTRKAFIKLVRLFSVDHDNEIIARRIFPDIGIDCYNSYVHGTSLRDLGHYTAGLFKRILPNYYVVPEVYDDFFQFSKSIIDSIEPIQHVPFLDHESLDLYWLDNSTKYNQKQKKHFHDLLQAYVDEGPMRDFIQCSSFVKEELYPEPKFARIINSRSDTFKAVTAPYTKLIEERIFVDTFPNNFIKHHEPEWIGQRLFGLLDRFHVVYETDYSSFESSFSTPILAIEKYFFNHLLSNNPEVQSIINRTLDTENILKSRLGITTSVMGTRMSGEMWTSLGNGFMNFLLVSYVAHVSNVEADFVVEGDDCCVGFSGTPRYYVVEHLGFKLKLQLGTHVNDISFCGYKIRPDKKPVVDIPRVAHNTAYSRRPEILNSTENRKFKLTDYMSCIMLSRYMWCRYTPILNVLYYRQIKDFKFNNELLKQYLNWYNYDFMLKFDINNIPPPILDENLYSYFEGIFHRNRSELMKLHSEFKHVSADQHIYFAL